MFSKLGIMTFLIFIALDYYHISYLPNEVINFNLYGVKQKLPIVMTILYINWLLRVINFSRVFNVLD